MLSRLKEAVEAGRAAVVDAGAVPEQQVDALLILDELGPLADETRQRHLASASAAGHRALFILGPEAELEHHDLSLLCEFIPRGYDLAASTGQRPDTILRYRQARLGLILDKWNVTECRWVGDSAEELIESLPTDGHGQMRQTRFLPAH